LPASVITVIAFAVMLPFGWAAWKWGDLELIAPPGKNSGPADGSQS